MRPLANLILRPHREIYDLSKLRPQKFLIIDKEFTREDVILAGKRGNIIGSWYSNPARVPRRCIIYCHGNSGSQLDVEEILEISLINNFSVFSFDFSGSGRSDGEFVSLGYYEKNDLETAVNFIYSRHPKMKVYIWGRSMGAAASIFYIFCNPHITALILDSPFSDFREAVDRFISEFKVIPKFVRSAVFDSTCKYIERNYKFNLNELRPIDFLNNCKVPTVFIHSVQDSLIEISSSRDMYETTKGPKCLLEVSGEHNTARSHNIIVKTLRIVQLLLKTNKPVGGDVDTERNKPPHFQSSTLEYLKKKKLI